MQQVPGINLNILLSVQIGYGLCFVLFTACAIGGLSERYCPRCLRVLFDVLRLG